MSFKITGSAANRTLGGHAFVAISETRYSTVTEMIQAMVKLGKTNIKIPDKVYNEDVTVPLGVNLYSRKGEINGKVITNGNNTIATLKIKDLEINGECNLDRVVLTLLHVIDGKLNGETIQVERQCRIVNSNVTLSNSILSNTTEHAIRLEKGVCLLNNCTVEGPSYVDGIMDLKNCSINEEMDVDLFETVLPSNTVQLFNCNVYGIKRIKSGPGTSIRANLFTLGPAVELVGGENIALGSI